MIQRNDYTCLVNQYIDMVWRIALGRTKSPHDAQDITQNVFLALLRSNKEFESEEHAKHWLLRVTVNECKKWFRLLWRRDASYEEYIQGIPFANEESRELMEAVMALPEKYRLSIYLYYYENCSTEEIAGILGWAKGTVCSNLARGREMLKKWLQEDE